MLARIVASPAACEDGSAGTSAAPRRSSTRSGASVVSITAIGALMVLGGQVGTLYGLLKHLCDAIASAIAG